MNGPLKGTPHVDYCLLTAPGVCVQIWDLMCSSTFVQGVVITVVTVHTHVCVSFLHSILMDYDSTRYAVEVHSHRWGPECVSQQGLATVLYSSTHASVAVLDTNYLSTGKLYSQWSLKDAQTWTVAYTATFRATSTRYVKCNGWWCNFSRGQLHKPLRATPTSFLFVPCGLSSVSRC